MASLRLRPGAAHHELMSEIQLIDPTLYRSLIERARKSPRLRINHNFHTSMEDNPHRFLNVLLKGTYIAPHRHLDPPKFESFLVLDGEIAFFTFDDAGRIAGTHVLGRDAVGIDVPPGVWHTMVPLTDHAICYEVKPGPYVAATDKQFAAWAPAEGDARAGEYVQTLLRACRADEGVY